MNSTAVFSDTDINQAKLISQLSNRPAKVQDDVFIWNGHLIDRATAIVALLKINNQVPVGDGVKMRMKDAYDSRFKHYIEEEDLVGIESDDRATSSRIWFNLVCRAVRGNNPELLSKEVVKQILIDLHRN